MEARSGKVTRQVEIPSRTTLASAPTIESLVKPGTFATEGENLRVRFRDLELRPAIDRKAVTKAVIETMPESLRNLNGKQIVVSGFMRPSFELTDIQQFTLREDQSPMNFGPYPEPDRLIFVQLQTGEVTDYLEQKAFDVSGTFRIEAVAVTEQSSENEQIAALYFLDNAHILPR